MYTNRISTAYLFCFLLLSACRIGQSYAPLSRVTTFPTAPLQNLSEVELGIYHEIDLHGDAVLVATERDQIAVALTTGEIGWFDLESGESHLFTGSHTTGVVDLHFSGQDRLVSVGRHAEGYEILRWDVVQKESDGTARWVENYDLPDRFSPVSSRDGLTAYLIQEKTITVEQGGLQSQLTWPHDVLATAVSDRYPPDDEPFLLIADETGVSLVEVTSKEIVVHYSYEQLNLKPHTAVHTYLLTFDTAYLVIAQDSSLRILSIADK